MEYTTYKDYMYVNLVDYNDDELIDIHNGLDAEYGRIVEEWGADIAKLINVQNVDPFSFFGKRKVDKLNNKYADKTSDIQILIEDIEKELEKRDKYNFEQSFIGGKSYHDKTLTEKEFFEKEELKTLKYKQSIRADRTEDEEYDAQIEEFDDED